MGNRGKYALLLLLAGLFFFHCLPSSFAQRIFPEVTEDVNDLAGVLSQEDVAQLSEELQYLREFHYMPGVIVITDRTGEWDFIEYAHDFLDYLRSQGILDHSSFLIYLSVDDRKMAFVLGNDIGRIIDPGDVRAIRNELGSSLQDGEYFNGLSRALTKLKALPGPAELEDARQQRGQWMILAGLIILIAVFFMNLSKRRRSLRLEE